MYRCCLLAALYLGVLIGDSAPTETIAGKVVQDDSGAPLPSVEVRISRAGSPSLVADVETDTSGQFRAPDLPPAEYRLEVSKPNYVSTFLSVREPGATTMLIRLVRRGVISGQVTDAQGQPVRGATIFAMVKTASSELFRPFATNAPKWTNTGSTGSSACLQAGTRSRFRMGRPPWRLDRAAARPLTRRLVQACTFFPTAPGRSSSLSPEEKRFVA